MDLVEETYLVERDGVVVGCVFATCREAARSKVSPKSTVSLMAPNGATSCYRAPAVSRRFRVEGRRVQQLHD